MQYAMHSSIVGNIRGFIHRTALRETLCYDILVHNYTSFMELIGDAMQIPVPGYSCEDRLRVLSGPSACCCLCPGLAAPACSAASLIPLGWTPGGIVAV